MKATLLFGGTFDPVHAGHVAMATAALAETGATHLTLLPAGNPYQRGRAPFASAADRQAMLGVAFEGMTKVSIDRRELSREGNTYTADTLREIRAEQTGETALIWLIGSDAFSRLDTWHQWESLFTLAHFAVVQRQDGAAALTIASAPLLTALSGRRVDVGTLANSASGQFAELTTRVPPVSSTAIRGRLQQRQSIRGFAPDAVCDYIEHHKLYEQKEKPYVGY